MKLLKTVAIVIILTSLSACSSSPSVVQVLIPPKPYHGTVKLSEILKCPDESVQISVYRNLRMREQYIETLIDVINAHNGEGE